MAMVKTYRGLEASGHFELTRLKNKIGKCEGPFNLHVNVKFHPSGYRDPMLCEVQLYPNPVFEL